MDALYRDPGRRMVAGVCAGLADYFAVDRSLIRLVFVLWALASRTGFMAYVVLWLMLPVRGSPDRSREQLVRDGVAEMRQEATAMAQQMRRALGGPVARTAPDRRTLVLGGALIALGLVLLAENTGLLGWIRLGNLWPLVLILAGVVMLRRALKRD